MKKVKHVPNLFIFTGHPRQIIPMPDRKYDASKIVIKEPTKSHIMNNCSNALANYVMCVWVLLKFAIAGIILGWA